MPIVIYTILVQLTMMSSFESWTVSIQAVVHLFSYFKLAGLFNYNHRYSMNIYTW